MVVITAMTLLAKQIGANRIVSGIKIPHPCGDPTFPEESDRAVRREIVRRALDALQKSVEGPTIFEPAIKCTSE